MEEVHVNFLCCFVLGCGLNYYEGQKLKGNDLYNVSKNSLDREYEWPNNNNIILINFLLLYCAVPENIHTPHTGGFFVLHPPLPRTFQVIFIWFF